MDAQKIPAKEDYHCIDKVTGAFEDECEFLGAVFCFATKRGSMFVETLPEATQRSLALLGKQKITQPFYLAGGSALALHLGHRISVDLDFFTPHSFEVSLLAQRVRKAGDFIQDQRKKNTLVGTLDSVKISFFCYPYPTIAKKKTLLRTAIASIEDIGAMKVEAIGTRGRKRDFVDLFFICQAGYAINDVFNWYQKKFSGINVNLTHYVKALTYFAEAEADPMPRMLKKVSWGRIERFFEEQGPKLLKTID